MTPLSAALAYAAAGFPVFPCNPCADKAKGSKAPLTPKASAQGEKDGGHWLASKDAATIEGWWSRWPKALVGFPTGLRSGTVVIDLDAKTYSPAEMLAALTHVCGGGLSGIDAETGEILPPAVVSTQSGGLHLYFRYPDPEEIEVWRERVERQKRPFEGFGNRGDIFRRFIKHNEADAVLAHIDARGEGGYVIAPPSVLENGKSYVWLNRPVKNEAGAWLLPALPPRLAAVLVKAIIPHAERMPAPRFGALSGRHVAPGHASPRVKAFVHACIDGALKRSRDAAPGGRHAALYRSALSLSRFVKSGHLPAAEAERLLLDNLPGGFVANTENVLRSIRNGVADLRGIVPAFDPSELGQGDQRSPGTGPSRSKIGGARAAADQTEARAA